MIASSGTVLSNLAYLIGAVVVAAIGGLIVWMRHRQPKSVDANMASFRRGLSALAPDPRGAAGATVRRSDGALRPPASGLIHVKIEPTPAAARSGAGDSPAAGEAVADGVGEHAG